MQLYSVLFLKISMAFFQGTKPSYVEIVHLCVLRRYEKRNGLSSNSKDLIAVYREELMLLQSLRKGESYFEENQGVLTGSLWIKFRFLSMKAGGSKSIPLASVFKNYVSAFILHFRFS